MTSEQIELPATVSQYAAAAGVPRYRVYDSINLGTMEIAEDKRPKLIIAGELAMTKAEWIKRLEPAAKRLPNGVWGFDEDGAFFATDRRANVLKIGRGLVKAQLRRAIAEIEAFAERFAP